MFVLILAAGVATTLLAGSGRSPVVGAAGKLACPASFVLGWAAAWFLSRRSMIRSARAELDEEKVGILSEPYRVTLFWRDIDGFRDHDADFVEVVTDRWPRGYPKLGIPTLSEQDRTAVLAFLDARGLRRLD